MKSAIGGMFRAPGAGADCGSPAVADDSLDAVVSAHASQTAEITEAEGDSRVPEPAQTAVAADAVARTSGSKLLARSFLPANGSGIQRMQIYEQRTERAIRNALRFATQIFADGHFLPPAV